MMPIWKKIIPLVHLTYPSGNSDLHPFTNFGSLVNHRRTRIMKNISTEISAKLEYIRIQFISSEY